MQKHVVSVGFEIPGVNECVDFNSDTSLLDADIVVFSPNLEEYTVDDNYRGRAALRSMTRDAFRLTQPTGIESCASHLKREKPSLS